MVQGALLGASSIIVRLIGLIYRVPLNNILGEKGVAYYGIAFDVYSVLLLLSSYSLPLAVSKMVSARVAKGEYRNVKRLLGVALLFSLALGLTAFCITFFGAEGFARLLNFEQSAFALKILSPALIILSVLGVLRGFFQGLGTMAPTAVSNIIEQIVNAIVSIVAAAIMFKAATKVDEAEWVMANQPEARGAGGGTLGTVLGAAAALAFMIMLYLAYRSSLDKKAFKDKTSAKEPVSNMLKVITITIIPVILCTTVYNLGSILDSGLFSRIMAAKGMEQDTIDTLTGMYKNYRLIVNVPIALASALASSLIPSIVASMTLKKRREVIMKIESAVKLTVLISLPCAVGIGCLAKPIVNFLFSSSSDPDKVALMLILGCISVVLYSISTITNSILQGIDKMRLPVIHSAAALLIHIALLSLFMYITDANIFVVVVTDALFALTVCIFNHRSLKKILNYKQEYKRTFGLPCICSAIMGLVVFLVNKGIYAIIHSNAVSVLFSIIIAVIVYFVLLLLLKAVDEEELKMLPGGRKLTALARKLRLIK